MAVPKPQFAAVPTRAIGDPRLTDGDVRVIAAVAAFDRLSHARGSGQGAWASHATMARWLGRNYSTFSATMNKLLRLGYLVREPRATDRRQFTYRVVYTDDDRVPSAEEVCHPTNQSGEEVCAGANDPTETVCPAVGERPEIVCPEGDEIPENSDTSLPEYIPQSGVINSAKQGNKFSKAARSNGSAIATKAWLDADIEEPSIVGMLARVERAFRANPESIGDINDNIEWLESIAEQDPDDNGPIYQRAKRMLDDFDAYLAERDGPGTEP